MHADRIRSTVLATLTATLISVGLALAAAPAFAKSGDLDRSFGDRGTTRAELPDFNPDLITDMAVDGQGRTVVSIIYDFDFVPTDFTVVRFRADGSLDPSFGEGGVVKTDLGGDEQVNAITIDSEDRIIAGGTILTRDGPVRLVRYLPDGSLDPSFGDGGVATGASGFITALDVDNRDRVLVAGGTRKRVDIRRFDENGRLDQGFADVNLRNHVDRLDTIVAGPGKSITAGGTNDRNARVVRLRGSGKLDRRFGKRGVGSYFGKPKSDVLDLALDDHGSVVASGSHFLKGSKFSINEFFVLKINRNGSPMRSFGRRGAARFTFKCRSTNIGCDQDAMSVNVDDKGRIVAAGTAVVRRAPNSRFVVLRLSRRGKLDRSFGRRGKVFWQVGRTYPCYAAIDPRGRIIALAGSNNGSGQAIQLARYLP